VRSSVKLGGYAVILLTLIDMRRTSPTLTLFFLFLFLQFQRLILVPSIPCSTSRQRLRTSSQSSTIRTIPIRRTTGLMASMGRTREFLVMEARQLQMWTLPDEMLGADCDLILQCF
jgi:hypothetical protein